MTFSFSGWRALCFLVAGGNSGLVAGGNVDLVAGHKVAGGNSDLVAGLEEFQI